MLGATFKFAAKSYGAVSSAIHTIRHPIQAVQDALREVLLKALVKAVLAFAGERVAEELKTRVQVEKQLDLTLAIPEKMRSTVLDEDALAFATNLANDALAAPLAVLGLSLGELVLSKHAEDPVLQVRGVFRLVSSADSAGLVAAQSAPALPVASARP